MGNRSVNALHPADTDRDATRKRRPRRPWSRRRKVVWSIVLLAMSAALFMAYPLLRLLGVATRDALNPLPDVPAPYEFLPPATAPPLPSDRLVFDSDRSGNFEILTMAADGGDPQQLTDDPRYDSWWPRVSPDRARILFYRAAAGTHDRDATRNSLWMMNADGSGALEIRPRGTDGWRLQAHAEWSPDGSRLVMFGGSRFNPQIYLTSASGRRVARLTDRPGTNVDPSWSPDGATVYFVGCPGTLCFERDYEIYSVPSAGGPVVRLTDDGLRDQDPYASPDGRRLAWLTETSTAGIGQWNIRIADADGSNPRRVTDDEHVNSKPEWSRDGRLIYFHRLEVGRRRAFGIFSIRPDGTELTELTPESPTVSEYPGT